MKRSSHGNTPAAWYSSLIILIGFIVGALGVGAFSLVITIVGAALVLGGVAVALVMQRLGLGQFAPEASRSVSAAEAHLGRRRDED